MDRQTEKNMSICWHFVSLSVAADKYKPYQMLWWSWKEAPSGPGWTCRSGHIAVLQAAQEPSTSTCRCLWRSPGLRGTFKSKYCITMMILLKQDTRKQGCKHIRYRLKIVKACKEAREVPGHTNPHFTQFTSLHFIWGIKGGLNLKMTSLHPWS